MPLSYLPPGPAKLGILLWGLGLSCPRAVYYVSREVPAVARMPRHLQILSLYAQSLCSSQGILGGGPVSLFLLGTVSLGTQWDGGP